jgi:small subunit ribosomal protein S6
MRLYETGIILNPQLEESQFDKEVEDVRNLIKSNGGEIKDVNRWGMKRLAYEINKKHQGYYTFFLYESEGEVPSALERSFALNENVMRFMTVRADWLEGADEEEPRRPQRRTESRDER